MEGIGERGPDEHPFKNNTLIHFTHASFSLILTSSIIHKHSQDHHTNNKCRQGPLVMYLPLLNVISINLHRHVAVLLWGFIFLLIMPYGTFSPALTSLHSKSYTVIVETALKRNVFQGEVCSHKYSCTYTGIFLHYLFIINS